MLVRWNLCRGGRTADRTGQLVSGIYARGAGGQDRTGQDAGTDHSALRSRRGSITAGTRPSSRLGGDATLGAHFGDSLQHPARAVEHARRAEPLGIVHGECCE